MKPAENDFQMIIREFDTIPFNGVIDLLSDCGYSNAFMDRHDRKLLSSVLSTWLVPLHYMSLDHTTSLKYLLATRLYDISR